MPQLMKKLKINKKLNAGSGDVQINGAQLNNGSAHEVPTRSTRGTADTNNSRHSTAASASGNSNGNRRPVSSSSLLKYTHSRPGYREMHSRPMIIRPGTNQIAKKSAPPRPPPPKLKKPHPASSGPPSYDDVLRADLNAFMGEAKAPRPKPKAPARPATLCVAPKQADLLIDFDAPPSTNRVDASQIPKISLLDMPILADAPTTFLTNGAIKPIQRSSSYTFDNLSADPWSDGGNSAASLFRRSSNPSKSNSGPLRGDDWLQSCLNGATSLDHGDGFSTAFNSVPLLHSSPPPPPLPPRPRITATSPSPSTSSRQILFGMIGRELEPPSTPSPEPPLSSPPPVPPLPTDDLDILTFHSQVGLNCDHDVDDDKFDDDMPPLPPRPKLGNIISGPHAIAIYDYSATQHDDLSFRTGDVITLVQRVNDEWLYGANGEREGVFPKNFVDIVVPLNHNVTSPIEEKSIEGCRCRALYDFVSVNDGELSIHVGEVLTLIERVDSDWFRGSNSRGAIGLFPVNYVEEFQENEVNGDSRRKSTSNNLQLQTSSMYVAIYDFTGEPGELTFWEGDEIEVTGVVNDDWLVGRLKSGHVSGRLPKNFVQPL